MTTSSKNVGDADDLELEDSQFYDSCELSTDDGSPACTSSVSGDDSPAEGDLCSGTVTNVDGPSRSLAGVIAVGWP
jgi:hypothetical protein